MFLGKLVCGHCSAGSAAFGLETFHLFLYSGTFQVAQESAFPEHWAEFLGPGVQSYFLLISLHGARVCS